MRGRMSLVGAIARGLLVFTAMTASLAVALFVAVTGPPSADEMRGLRIVADQTLQQAQVGATQLGATICTKLPRTWQRATECASAAATTQEASASTSLRPRSRLAAAPRSPEQVPAHGPTQGPEQASEQALGQEPEQGVVSAPTPQDDPRLLGAAPSTQATTVPVSLPSRHVVAPRYARAHLARPRPIAHRPVRRARAPHAQRVSAHSHATPHRPAPPPVHRAAVHAPPIIAPPQAPHASAHTTPIVAPPQSVPPAATPAVAVPHPQFAAPEPRVAAPPASVAPAQTPNDAQLEKQDPTQARTF